MKEKRLSFKLILRQLQAFAEKLSKNRVVALIIQNKNFDITILYREAGGSN